MKLSIFFSQQACNFMQDTLTTNWSFTLGRGYISSCGIKPNSTTNLITQTIIISIFVLPRSFPRTHRDEGDEEARRTVWTNTRTALPSTTLYSTNYSPPGIVFGDSECFVYSPQKFIERGVVYSTDGGGCKHVFLSSSYKRINTKTAVRRFNSKKHLSGARHRAKKPTAKSLQLADYAFIL